ncbi:hypothetical protein [uncultured Allobaculum sp.]|nr:hypothetical protein [uncultured Allobaculum sp.]
MNKQSSLHAIKLQAAFSLSARRRRLEKESGLKALTSPSNWNDLDFSG